MANEEWIKILNQVKNGELTAEEAAHRMEGADPAVPRPDELPGELPARVSQADVPLQDLGWWKNAWLIPIWVGTMILVLSAWLLSWGYANERFFWFYCSWLPLLLGMAVLLLGVWSRQARWLHVRINEKGSPRVAISLPIPTRFAGWLLRILRPVIPPLQDAKLDNVPELLSALGDLRDPIEIEVDEKGGDRVRVYIQ